MMMFFRKRNALIEPRNSLSQTIIKPPTNDLKVQVVRLLANEMIQSRLSQQRIRIDALEPLETMWHVLATIILQGYAVYPTNHYM